MNQFVILSGKGGTGKTSVTAALAYLASNGNRPLRTVLADADVDAANLELLLAPDIQERHTFIGGKTAIIGPQFCGQCGTCKTVCRFDAVIETDEGFQIDPIACDGCGACVYQCPDEAIRMESEVAGEWFKSDSQFGPLFHAALIPAQENSGKLVSVVKEQAKQLAIKDSADLTLIDGPPGIGCAVISAISGADLALIVSEPTAAGVHDMERVLEIARQFKVPVFVCINKADIYIEGAEEIEMYCEQNGIEVIGRIPFDPAVTDAMVQGQTVISYDPISPASMALNTIWQELIQHIN